MSVMHDIGNSVLFAEFSMNNRTSHAPAEHL